MVLLKNLSDSWNAFLRKMRKQEEGKEIKWRTNLSFPTTGIIGAIAGDCFGAAYEFHPVKQGDFDIYKEPRLTDDTVMTLAVATKGMEMPEELARCVYKCLMIIFVRYLMSLTGAIKQESCRHHCLQDSLSKTGPIVPTLLVFSL